MISSISKRFPPRFWEGKQLPYLGNCAFHSDFKTVIKFPGVLSKYSHFSLKLVSGPRAGWGQDPWSVTWPKLGNLIGWGKELHHQHGQGGIYVNIYISAHWLSTFYKWHKALFSKQVTNLLLQNFEYFSYESVIAINKLHVLPTCIQRRQIMHISYTVLYTYNNCQERFIFPIVSIIVVIAISGASKGHTPFLH